MIELWFTFSLIWSVCASVDEDGRKKMDNFLREMEGTFPNKVFFYICLRHQHTRTKVYCVNVKCLTRYINNPNENYRELAAEMLYFDQDTIYEYCVDAKNKSWSSFENQLPKGWRYKPK